MAAEPFKWRFVVTDLDSAILTFLDRLSTNRSLGVALNLPSSASGDAPADSPEVNTAHTDGDPFLAHNNRLLYALRLEDAGVYVPHFGGPVHIVERAAGTEAPMVHYTAYDPWKLLYKRPIRRADGFLPTNVLSFTATRGSEIALALLENTHLLDGPAHIDFGQTAFYGGTIEDTAEIDITFDQGSSVGDAWTKLTETGTLDIVLTPVYDPMDRPGIVCELSIFVQAGSTRYDAVMAWDRPSRSLAAISDLRDGTEMANKVQFFTSDGRTAGAAQVDAASVAKYGPYWAQEFSPDQAVPAAVELLALAQVELRKRGKETLTASPIAGRAPWALRDYGPGDFVPTYASRSLGAPVTGLHRVHAIPFTISDDGAETVSDVLLTPPETA